MTRVKNINGTSQRNCNCGSWLKHWEKFSGQTANCCGVIGCQKTDVLGTHVQESWKYDNRWYIVPLCYAHNQSPYELDVSLRLISANVQETC